MFTYVPNIFHPILSIVLVVGFVFFGADQPRNRFIALSVVGGLLSLIVFAITLRAIVIESNNRRSDSASRFMEAWVKLDDDGKAVVAFEFPTIHYHMRRGVPHPYWGDTGIRLEYLQRFLEDSDKQYIAAERYWNSTEKPRKVWENIKAQLEDDGMVERDSAAGSHSWKWVGDSYQRMLAWWKVGRKIKEDVDIAMSGPTKQYASEIIEEKL
jgi:hypothetical protein